MFSRRLDLVKSSIYWRYKHLKSNSLKEHYGARSSKSVDCEFSIPVAGLFWGVTHGMGFFVYHQGLEMVPVRIPL